MFSDGAAWQPAPVGNFTPGRLRDAERHRGAHPKRSSKPAARSQASRETRERNVPVLYVLAISLLVPSLPQCFWQACTRKTRLSGVCLPGEASSQPLTFGPWASFWALLPSCVHFFGGHAGLGPKTADGRKRRFRFSSSARIAADAGHGTGSARTMRGLRHQAVRHPACHPH